MLFEKDITLRLFKKEDLEQYLVLANDFACRGDFLPLHINNPMELQRQFNEHALMTEDYGRFLIVENGTDRMIGYIVFFKTTHYMAGLEVGYVIFDGNDRGKGYGTQAMKLMVGWLFAAKPINRLQITADAGNFASARIAEKCGFKHEGVMKGAAFSRGKYNDLMLLAITREMYNQL